MADIPELLQGLLKFSEYASQLRASDKFQSSNEVDLCDQSLLYPTTLLPLLNFIQENKKQAKCIHSQNTIMAQVSSKFQKEEKLELPNEGTYAVKLTRKKESIESLDTLYKLRDKECECGGENTFKLLVGELVDNIYQHSEFTNAFVMGQKYQEKRFVELCFFDNGISIPGSYKKQGFEFKDPEAIMQASRGFSTKGEDRGRGLPYAIGVVTRGLGGEILIASGKAALYKSPNMRPIGADLTFEFVKEPPFRGTIISIRIPFSTKVIDYTKFV